MNFMARKIHQAGKPPPDHSPHSTGGSRLIRRPRVVSHLLTAALVATTFAGAVHATPASAGTAANCDTTTPSQFYNSLLPEDRAAPYGPAAMETALRATGKLYLCSLDQFYVPPTSLTGYTAGQVIRARPLYPSPGGPNTVAMRLMYVSTLNSGQLAATTGLVVLPRTAPPSSGRTSFEWTHGTAGIADSCVDGLDALWSIPSNAGPPGARSAFIDPAMSRNTAFLAPDYFGIGAKVPGRQFHSYMVMKEQSTAALDLVRAAANIYSVTAATKTVAVMGHSQGGQTALSMVEYQPTYAPDINVKTTVAISPPGNLVDLFGNFANSTSNDQFFSAFAAFGIAQAYPNVKPTEMIDTTHPDWFANTAYSLMWDLSANDGNAANVYQVYSGKLAAHTPDGAIRLGLLAQSDAKTYSDSNLAFATPRPGRLIVGCDYDAMTKITEYARSLNGQKIYASGYSSSPTGLALKNSVLPENSAPRKKVSTPTAYLIGNCDGLMPLTVPALKECGGPAPDANSLNANVPPNTLQTTARFTTANDPVIKATVGYSWGPALKTAQNLCAVGTTTTAKIYGDSDFNVNGRIDPSDTVPVSQAKVYDHSTLVGTAGSNVPGPAAVDAWRYVDDIFNGVRYPTCN